MKRTRRRSLLDLVQENKEALLKDLAAMEEIESRLEEKHMRRGQMN